MVETVETLVVGGGQAGVAMSEHLGREGLSHLVLERHRIAERWRSERWDSLVTNGPAWHDRFPGLAFPDADPTLGGPCVDDDQCKRDEIPCATFACDQTVKRCRATPDDTRCDDGLYCNGAERCDPRLGCVAGAVNCPRE